VEELGLARHSPHGAVPGQTVSPLSHDPWMSSPRGRFPTMSSPSIRGSTSAPRRSAAQRRSFRGLAHRRADGRRAAMMNPVWRYGSFGMRPEMSRAVANIARHHEPVSRARLVPTPTRRPGATLLGWPAMDDVLQALARVLSACAGATSRCGLRRNSSTPLRMTSPRAVPTIRAARRIKRIGGVMQGLGIRKGGRCARRPLQGHCVEFSAPRWGGVATAQEPRCAALTKGPQTKIKPRRAGDQAGYASQKGPDKAHLWRILQESNLRRGEGA
jgi:hypothetical protein